MGTAGQQLSHTAELVELILLELPFEDILFAQRVTRFWKSTIQGSPKLLRSLFLMPTKVIGTNAKGRSGEYMLQSNAELTRAMLIRRPGMIPGCKERYQVERNDALDKWHSPITVKRTHVTRGEYI